MFENNQSGTILIDFAKFKEFFFKRVPRGYNFHPKFDPLKIFKHFLQVLKFFGDYFQ